jgi:hypothetical protein
MPRIAVKIVRVGRPLMFPDLVVDDANTVAQLKQEIQSKKKIPLERQLLVYYKEILKEDMTLKSYGIDNKSKIRLSEYKCLPAKSLFYALLVNLTRYAMC